MMDLDVENGTGITFDIAAEDILLMRTPNVRDEEFLLARTAIEAVVMLANTRITVHDMDVWAAPGFENRPNVTHNSIGGYVNAALNRKTNELNTDVIFHLLETDPYQLSYRHMKVIITAYGLYDNLVSEGAFRENRTEREYGIAQEYMGAVISVDGLRGLKNSEDHQRMTVYHEIGHLLGVPREKRTDTVDDGNHCGNDCVMRIDDPSWKDVARQREISQMFCQSCINDLRKNPDLPRVAKPWKPMQAVKRLFQMLKAR